MDQYIIALSGRKGAGKNTIATFIREYWARHMLKTQGIRESMPNLVRGIEEGYISTDTHADAIAKKVIDEFTLECSFADNLKGFCVDTLGLSHNQCYGTDDEKGTLTDYFWENVHSYLRWKFGSRKMKRSDLRQPLFFGTSNPKELFDSYISSIGEGWRPVDIKSGPMSGREIMQIFGTDLVRETFGNVWASATIRKIKKSAKSLSVITDNRFPNEVKAVLREPKGTIIRLTRSPFGTKDLHPSEASLDGYDWNRDKCFILDNVNMTIDEQNGAVVPILNDILGFDGE